MQRSPHQLYENTSTTSSNQPPSAAPPVSPASGPARASANTELPERHVLGATLKSKIAEAKWARAVQVAAESAEVTEASPKSLKTYLVKYGTRTTDIEFFMRDNFCTGLIRAPHLYAGVDKFNKGRAAKRIMDDLPRKKLTDLPVETVENFKKVILAINAIVDGWKKSS